MTHTLPGLVLTDHELEVPLDHASPGGERITVFAREVAEHGVCSIGNLVDNYEVRLSDDSTGQDDCPAR